jgi:hypothetical protein
MKNQVGWASSPATEPANGARCAPYAKTFQSQFAKLFNYLGPLAFRVLARYDYPWEVFCRVMRGDRSFAEIKKPFRPDILFRKLLVKSARNRPIA